MSKLTIKTDSTENFFVRGKRLAELADQGDAIPKARTVSYEDPADLLNLLTPRRIALLKAIKKQPDSVASLAKRLQRDQRIIKHDVHVLEEAGLVAIESQDCSGGKTEVVCVTASEYRLVATIA